MHSTSPALDDKCRRAPRSYGLRGDGVLQRLLDGRGIGRQPMADGLAAVGRIGHGELLAGGLRARHQRKPHQRAGEGDAPGLALEVHGAHFAGTLQFGMAHRRHAFGVDAAVAGQATRRLARPARVQAQPVAGVARLPLQLAVFKSRFAGPGPGPVADHHRAFERADGGDHRLRRGHRDRKSVV